MKGKGKIKNEVKPKVDVIDELPVKAAEFIIPDVNDFPTYMSAVKKEDGHIAIKDLISLQNELESMHLSMMKRQQQLKTEIDNLENPTAKRNKRSRSTDSVGKKCAKKSKKCKGNGKKASTCRPKNKFVQPPPKSYECGVTDAQVEVPKLQKNDGPTRFWSFIEPYCADITQDDIKAIEAWIKSHDDDDKYQEIPALETHFADKWKRDDLDEEMKEGSKSVENQKGSINAENFLSDKERILKMGDMQCKQMEIMASSSQNNSLVQRLVSTYVQENVITSLDVCLTDSSKDSSSLNSKKKASKSACMSPTKESLQKKLYKEFSEIGVMDAEETESDYSEDEILMELKRLQKALIPVCNRNLRQKKHLLALAKIKMKKQDIKKKLKEVDAKIMEMYRAIHSAVCERKTPPKKYTAQIKETLAKRQKIIEELDRMC